MIIMRQGRPTTTDAIIVKNGKILLIKRDHDPFEGYWALPGGYIDFNETAEQACKREVKEETNMKTRSLRLLGIYSSPKRDIRNQTVAVAYIIKADGKPKAGDDAADTKWFPLNKLPKLAFDHAQMIKDYKKFKKD